MTILTPTYTSDKAAVNPGRNLETLRFSINEAEAQVKVSIDDMLLYTGRLFARDSICTLSVKDIVSPHLDRPLPDLNSFSCIDIPTMKIEITADARTEVIEIGVVAGGEIGRAHV